jgi:hypothetical protein
MEIRDAKPLTPLSTDWLSLHSLLRYALLHSNLIYGYLYRISSKSVNKYKIHRHKFTYALK